ncbi:MAG: bifunctional nuclease family protein [Candidatus Kapabacteria bacterium]|nr:bifunctional nuclease family protein [Candidatus Kapabacteria bacterium]
MEKVQLIVLGLSASPASNNAYALILKEVEGNRRLPIIIGAFEAQAIALEMEEVMPPRPMTHDLLKTMLDQFNVGLGEVVINDLRDGTFYAELVFDSYDDSIDCRPSDAIALAMRCNAPIYVHRDILDETGVLPQLEDFDEAFGVPAGSSGSASSPYKQKKNTSEQEKTGKSKLDHLQQLLSKAINEENYERAADLRDEINRLLSNQ